MRHEPSEQFDNAGAFDPEPVAAREPTARQGHEIESQIERKIARKPQSAILAPGRERRTRQAADRMRIASIALSCVVPVTVIAIALARFLGRLAL